MVYECAPMINCDSTTWFNGCSKCKQNHTYKFDPTKNTVDYSDCEVYDDENCFAFFTNLENKKECKYCKSGYTKNIDGLCKLISAPKCLTN